MALRHRVGRRRPSDDHRAEDIADRRPFRRRPFHHVVVGGRQRRCRPLPVAHPRPPRGHTSGCIRRRGSRRDVQLPSGSWISRSGGRCRGQREPVAGQAGHRSAPTTGPSASNRASPTDDLDGLSPHLTANNILGSTLTVTGDGDAFYIVGRVGAAYGRMQVIDRRRIDDRRHGLLPGQARYRPTRDRVMLFSAYLAPGTHTVTITNAGSAGRARWASTRSTSRARSSHRPRGAWPSCHRPLTRPRRLEDPDGVPEGVADTHVDA